MGKKREIEVVINKPNREVLENLIAEAIAEGIILRLSKLPKSQRLATLEEILKKLKEEEWH